MGNMAESFNHFLRLYDLAFKDVKQKELGNLILRYSVPINTLSFPTFRRTLEALHVDCQNSTPLFSGFKIASNKNNTFDELLLLIVHSNC